MQTKEIIDLSNYRKKFEDLLEKTDFTKSDKLGFERIINGIISDIERLQYETEKYRLFEKLTDIVCALKDLSEEFIMYFSIRVLINELRDTAINIVVKKCGG